MTDLRDELTRLADDAPPGSLPAADLWRRGVRHRRRTRAVTLAVVAALVGGLALIGGLSHEAAQQPQPANPPAHGVARLPDRIYTPSGWLPGTADKGPLGRLVALVPATRHHFWGGDTDGVVGVSTDGTYRFLDLPDASNGESGVGRDTPVLSPDGRHVAYWTTGRPSGRPNAAHVITGLTVYDTSTGAVRRAAFETAHGLGPEQLLWVDNQRLVVQVGQWISLPRAGDEIVHERTYLWHPGSIPRRLNLLDVIPVAGATNGPHPVLMQVLGERGVTLRRLSDGTIVRRVRLDRRLGSNPVFSTGAGRVAGIWSGAQDNGLNPNRVLVGTVRPGTTHLRFIPTTTRSREVLGWAGPHHVVVTRIITPNLGAQYEVVRRVDVGTGEVQELARWYDEVQLATDVLSSPTFRPPAPPHPWNPRVTWGWALGLVIAAVLMLVGWRRRARP